MPGILRRGLRTVPLLALPFALTACDSLLGPANDQLLQEQVREKQAIWESKGIAEYTLVVARGSAFSEAPPAVAIHVVNNTIQSATYASDGTPVEPDVRAEQQTIPQMFAYLLTALDRKPVSFSINYSEEYGFPTLVVIAFDASNIDNIVISVESFTPGGG
jgi:hypothetical protein